MGDESSAVAQPQQADAHSLEEAQQKRPLLVVLGCIYRERKNELRQGIASFTKLPPTFNNTHDTFILVCADGALSQQGGASVQAVARKYMRLIGETWKGRDEAQRAFWEDDSRVQVTWFGAVKCGFVWASAANAAIPIMLLLKNTEQCVRQRKIWSHVLAFLLLRKAGVLGSSLGLMIDGDTAFDAHHVSRLVDGIKSRPNVAALSARIAPTSHGNLLLVAAQKVEYALAHYLDKVAELFLGGSALCAPGCFTLMRLEALVRDYETACALRKADAPPAPMEGSDEVDVKENTVLHRYGRLPRSMLGALKSLQGEDRFLSTLLITSHWKIDCLSNVVVTTACPAGWRSYVTQRRRWLPSTMANQFALITEYKQSMLFGWRKWLIVPHIILQLCGALLAIPLVTLLYSHACYVALGPLGYFVALFPPILFVLFCWIFYCDPADSNKKRTRNAEIQLACFQWMSTFYIAISVLIIGLLVWQVAASSVLNVWSPEAIFFGLLIVVYLAALVLHRDWGNAVRLPSLFLLVPVMYLLQPIYIVANMHDYRWGTREGNAQAPAPEEEDEEGFWSLFRHGVRRILCLSKRPKARPVAALPIVAAAAPPLQPVPPQAAAAAAAAMARAEEREPIVPPSPHDPQSQESPADIRRRRVRPSHIESSPGVAPRPADAKLHCDLLVRDACAPLNDASDSWSDAMQRLARPTDETYKEEADRLTQALLLAQASLVRWLVCVTLATVMFLVAFSAIGHTGPRSSGSTAASGSLWTEIPRSAGPFSLEPAHLPSYVLMTLWLLSLLVTTLCMFCERFAHGVLRLCCRVRY